MLLNDRGRVWNVSPSIALPSHVEVRVCVFGEPRKEVLEKGVQVFACLPAPVDLRHTFVLVGKPDSDRLVNEEEVEVLVPTVWVPYYVRSFVHDSTRSELEQQANQG